MHCSFPSKLKHKLKGGSTIFGLGVQIFTIPNYAIRNSLAKLWKSLARWWNRLARLWKRWRGCRTGWRGCGIGWRGCGTGWRGCGIGWRGCGTGWWGCGTGWRGCGTGWRGWGRGWWGCGTGWRGCETGWRGCGTSWRGCGTACYGFMEQVGRGDWSTFLIQSVTCLTRLVTFLTSSNASFLIHRWPGIQLNSEYAPGTVIRSWADLRR